MQVISGIAKDGDGFATVLVNFGWCKAGLKKTTLKSNGCRVVRLYVKKEKVVSGITKDEMNLQQY